MTDTIEHGIPTPIKVCGRCSVQSQTTGDFCPNCGKSFAQKRISARTKKIVAAILAVLLIAGIGSAAFLKIRHDNSADAKQAALAAAERDAAEVEAEAEAEVEAQQAQRIAEREAADRRERADRRSLVRQMQASITKDAKERVAEGVLEGPILYTSCDPLGGGSTDDLTALTTTFECLAVYKENADGTASGWVFSATANWNKSSWSWRLGS